jgi:hypothetical protein
MANAFFSSFMASEIIKQKEANAPKTAYVFLKNSAIFHSQQHTSVLKNHTPNVNFLC